MTLFEQIKKALKDKQEPKHIAAIFGVSETLVWKLHDLMCALGEL
jgi:hypothetical protein